MNPKGDQLLLAVDPGQTSGIAFFRDGVLLTAMSVTEDADGLERFLELLRIEWNTAVVESKPPTRHNQEAGAEVVKLVEDFCTDIHFVRPTQWKGHPASKLSPGDSTNNTHESDAVRMGRWWLATQRGSR